MLNNILNNLKEAGVIVKMASVSFSTPRPQTTLPPVEIPLNLIQENKIMVKTTVIRMFRVRFVLYFFAYTIVKVEK